MRNWTEAAAEQRDSRDYADGLHAGEVSVNDGLL